MKKANWGEDPDFFGPRDWYRNTLILNEVKKRLSHGKVLDFGCGSGNLLFRLSGNGYNVDGMDLSKLAVSFVKSKIKKERTVGVDSIFQGSEKNLATLKNKYNVITAGEVLEHIKNDNSVVKTFFKHLTKDGICVVSVPAHMQKWDINDDYSRHYRRYTKTGLVKLFKENGFTIEHVYYWGFPLSIFWHKFIFLPQIRKKSQKRSLNKINANLQTIFTKLNPFLSYIFYVDKLFDWSPFGNGLILVARKK